MMGFGMEKNVNLDQQICVVVVQVIVVLMFSILLLFGDFIVMIEVVEVYIWDGKGVVFVFCFGMFEVQQEVVFVVVEFQFVVMVVLVVFVLLFVLQFEELEEEQSVDVIFLVVWGIVLLKQEGVWWIIEKYCKEWVDFLIVQVGVVKVKVYKEWFLNEVEENDFFDYVIVIDNMLIMVGVYFGFLFGS